MNISEASLGELKELAVSKELKEDMAAVTRQRHNPFWKDGCFMTEAFLQFVSDYNAFINHRPKAFTPIKGEHFKL